MADKQSYGYAHAYAYAYGGVIQPKGFPGLPAGWVSEWETFAGVGAQQRPPGLFSVIHHADAWKTGRALVVVHGLFEHGGRYLHFPHYLQGAVDAVCCMDLPGHGRSEGLRGHIDDFDLLADDLILYVKKVEQFLKRRSPRQEIHLFGHSLGGLIAVRALMRDPTLPVKSASICSPLLGIAVDVPLGKRLAAGLLSRFWGTLHLLSQLDPKRLSHDAEVGEAYVTDRLVHQKVTPRFYSELRRAMTESVEQLRHSRGRGAPGFPVPLQVLLPLEDQIVDGNAVQRFYRDLKLSDKELKTYPHFYHEAFNEIGKEKVFEDIRTWITAHSAIS